MIILENLITQVSQEIVYTLRKSHYRIHKSQPSDPTLSRETESTSSNPASLNQINIKFRVFWDVAPCSQVDVDRRFRGV
jgi:hypothetical protein